MRSKPSLSALYQNWRNNPNADTEGTLWIAMSDKVGTMTQDEDIQQDVLLHAFAAMKDGRYTDRGKMTEWLSRMVRRAKINAAQKMTEDLLDAESLETIASSMPSPARLIIDLEALADPLDRMLAESILDGNTIREAAATCNLNESAARMRLRRLGQKLQNSCALLIP